MGDGYEATMRLAREHPELLPKLKKLHQLSSFLIFSDEEAAKMGVTKEELDIFRQYGVIREEGEA